MLPSLAAGTYTLSYAALSMTQLDRRTAVDYGVFCPIVVTEIAIAPVGQVRADRKKFFYTCPILSACRRLAAQNALIPPQCGVQSLLPYMPTPLRTPFVFNESAVFSYLSPIDSHSLVVARCVCVDDR